MAGEAYLLSEAELFALYSYIKLSADPSQHVNIRDLFPNTFVYGATEYKFLKETFKAAGIKLGRVGLYREADDEIKLPITAAELPGLPEQETSKIIEISKKLMEGPVTSDELDLVADYRSGVFSHLYLLPELDRIEKAELEKRIDIYIDLFMTNGLLLRDENCLLFERQKNALIQIIRKDQYIERFGENFIIDYEYSILGTGGFCFVHTLLALKKMEYLSIFSLKNTSNGMAGSVRANLLLDGRFINDVNASFRDENPMSIFEGFDEKSFSINFAKRQISLSKGRKETDAVLLMRTLSKEPDRDWFEDQIVDDWKFQPDDASKLKVYQAARKINLLVKDATGIGDFLLHNTKKFRINGKYLKT